MAFLEKFSKEPSGEEIMEHLRSFLAACNHMELLKDLDISKNKPLQDALETGFYLMKHLPVSREGVFYQISKIYNDLVSDYISQLENNQSVFGDDTDGVLELIEDAFIHYLAYKSDVWSPLLSTWSLQLLGQISAQYSQRQVLSRGQSVNETIHIWMSSKAIKSLLEVTSKCLRSSTNKDTFITALLDTSATHSPNFDWVVAHIGNSFPQTIVAEVLSLGLQNFSSNPPQPSKITSVVGILGHLVTTHSKEIQFSFDRILQDGLTVTDPVSENYAIPYLLRLCSFSVPLLDVLMDTTMPKINEETLNRLCTLVQQWIPLHFGGKDVAFMALVTHLILKSTKGPRALCMLLTGCSTWPPKVQGNAKSLLYHFTSELSSLIYRSDAARKDLWRSFPCVQSLKDEYESLLPFLLNPDDQIAKVAQQFTKLLSLYDSKDIGVSAICYYLREAREDSNLWSMVDIVCTLSMKYPNILSDCIKLVIARCVRRTETRCWKTMLRLLKTKIPPAYSEHFNVAKIIQENLPMMIPFLDTRKRNYSLQEAHYVAEIMCLVPNVTKGIRFGTVLAIERFLVELLFQVFGETSGLKRKRKIRTVSHISKLLFDMSSDQAVQNDALRSLVQICLNPENRYLFQARMLNFKGNSNDAVANDEDFIYEKFSMYAPLLQDNRRRTASISSARVHSTSFLTGKVERNRVINRNVSSKAQVIHNADAKLNVQLFLGVVTTVCMSRPVYNKFCMGNGNGHELEAPEDNDTGVSVEATRQVALLLVQIVSPDVMFNGLPWPDEDFSKVQVERDIQIRRAFEDHPYLWDLLEFVGNYSPSLCYCSVILRALMATLMAYWTTQQECRSSKSPAQLEWTVRLVNVMKQGQLVPPPLCYIGQVLTELKANEIVGLLKDVWTYMKLNVPVPSIFVKDLHTRAFVRTPDFYRLDVSFTEKLRLAILNNVEELGYLFPKFFPINGSGKRPQTLPLEVTIDDDSERPPQIQSPSPTKTVPPVPIPVTRIVNS